MQIHFLMKGHTLCDVDQLFSIYAKVLKCNNWTGIDELETLLRQSYKSSPPTIFTHNQKYDWKKWMKPHLCSMDGHQKSYYIEFKVIESGDIRFLYRGTVSFAYHRGTLIVVLTCCSGDVNPYDGIVGVNGTSRPILVWQSWPLVPHHLPEPMMPLSYSTQQDAAMQQGCYHTSFVCAITPCPRRGGVPFVLV